MEMRLLLLYRRHRMRVEETHQAQPSRAWRGDFPLFFLQQDLQEEERPSGSHTLTLRGAALCVCALPAALLTVWHAHPAHAAPHRRDALSLRCLPASLLLPLFTATPCTHALRRAAICLRALWGHLRTAELFAPTCCCALGRAAIRLRYLRPQSQVTHGTAQPLAHAW